jgi:hypothetical protein
MTCCDARFAAGARIEIDLERVLLMRLWVFEREQISVRAAQRFRRRMDLCKALDGSQRCLRFKQGGNRQLGQSSRLGWSVNETEPFER